MLPLPVIEDVAANLANYKGCGESVMEMSHRSAEFKAILACCVGGVSFSGGIGKTLGVFCGAIVIGVLGNGLTLMGVSEYWQYIINGALMLGAVAFDQFIQNAAIKRGKLEQAKMQEQAAQKAVTLQ